MFAIENSLFWEIRGIDHITFLILFWVVTSLYFHTLTDSVFRWHAYKIIFHCVGFHPNGDYACDLLLVILLNTHIRLDHYWAFDLISLVHVTPRPCCQPHFFLFLYKERKMWSDVSSYSCSEKPCPQPRNLNEGHVHEGSIH